MLNELTKEERDGLIAHCQLTMRMYPSGSLCHMQAAVALEALQGKPVLYRWWFADNAAQINITQPDMIDVLARKPGLIIEGLAPVTREEWKENEQ